MQFIYGIATGTVITILLLAPVRWAVFAERDARVRLASPLPRPTVPDKVEPHPATMHEPAPIQSHERHIVAYVGRPIREADVIQFPRRWDERSH